MSDIVIGIDLGTTNSCVSLFRKNVVEILENSEGGRLTSSCVFFLKKGGSAPIVGQTAKTMMDALPSNGIYEIKRFVGKNYDSVKNKLNYFSFKVDNDFDKPVVVIELENETKKLTPKDLSALILAKIKKDVEAKLGHSVTKAVITVPAYFNSTQREVTLEAANQAGFTVLKLFNEPSAAALSYYYKIEHSDDKDNSYSLVYDLGGGTFDVSILQRTTTDINILCVDGDVDLGGKDFDNIIIDYVSEELDKNYDFKIKEDRRQMRRLQNKCQQAKTELSTAEETTIVLDGFIINNPVVEIELTRKEFELRCQNLFKKTIDIVDRCLKRSKIPKDNIKDVVLSGGSSRIPKIQEMLSQYFNGKSLSKFLHLDECVAEGAALQAAMLSKDISQKIDTIRVTDVVPLSIGLSDWVDRMIFVIRRDSPIPVSETTTNMNVYNQQTSMRFKIFEGERLNSKNNRYLGSLVLEKITPAPPGQCEVSIELTVDENGVLKVKAKEKFKNNEKALTISYTKSYRGDNEVTNVVADAEEHQAEDEYFKKFANIKAYLLTYCETIKYNLDNLKLSDKYERIYKLCEQTFREGKLLKLEKKNYLEKLIEDVEKQCEDLITLHDFTFMPDRYDFYDF